MREAPDLTPSHRYHLTATGAAAHTVGIVELLKFLKKVANAAA